NAIAAKLSLAVVPAKTVQENTALPTISAPVVSGGPVGVVRWSLSGADASAFSVVSNGTVSFAAKDFESPTDSDGDNVYDATLTATDEDGNTADTALKVTVTNAVERKKQSYTVSTHSRAGSISSNLPLE
ncbi:hypothetical protein AB4431_01970, partial [Vibrio artabrorum]